MEKEELSAEIEILEKEVKEIENTELIASTSKIDVQIEINNGRLKLLETELENIEKLSEEDDTNQNVFECWRICLFLVFCKGL